MPRTYDCSDFVGIFFFVDSRIVSDAFETCNVSKTGKLSAKVCV